MAYQNSSGTSSQNGANISNSNDKNCKSLVISSASILVVILFLLFGFNQISSSKNSFRSDTSSDTSILTDGKQGAMMNSCSDPNFRRNTMWTKPTATDLRFGFEVTMYIAAK